MATDARSIFISYHRSDAEIARRIRSDLVRRGAVTWMDEFDIPPGAYWPDEIDKALDASTTVVGILSPDAIASRNVKNEWDWALMNDRRLVLVLVEPCTVPHRYVSLNWIDATQTNIDDALDAVANASGTPKHPASPVAERLPTPTVRYTRSGDGNVAWQRFGDGPIDVVLVPGFISHLEHQWANPSQAAWFRRLGSLARVVAFDKRGTGLSDRVGRVLTHEERIDDIRAVMDAAEVERAVVYGISEGGSLAALFAAIHPERTLGLIVYGGLASYIQRPDYPWALPYEEYRRRTEEMEATLHQRWGTEAQAKEILGLMAPSGANDPELIAWTAGLMRLGASPGAEVARRRMNIELDARGFLPTISVPAMVMHRAGDADVNVEEGRYIAEHIPGCRFVELPGNDHWDDLGDQESMFAAIGSFLDEVARLSDASGDGQRLTTAMCLDIPLGAQSLSDAASELARTAIDDFGGTIVDQTPRKLLVLFDGSIRAMRCAWTLRALLAEQGLAGRIGVHSGAVGSETSSGDAIVIAAQIASMATTGAIIVTQRVLDISPGSSFAFESLGEQNLGDLNQPVPLFLIDDLLLDPSRTTS